MKSYNCFYSALFDILEPLYHENTHLLLNNRWQFFYSINNDYTDDKRMIGEWPMLYDELHLKALKENFGINILFKKEKNSSLESFLRIGESASVLMFVNKYILKHLQPTSRCTSTIIAKRLNDSIYHCKTFDNDMDTFQKVDAEILYHSWMYASDFDHLNQCIISIEFLQDDAKPNLCEFAEEYIRYNLIDYLTSRKVGNIFFGNLGIKRFSNDILNWNKEDFQKFFDCSIYMDILIKQRMYFISTYRVLLMDYNIYTIIEKVQLLIEKWNKLKMLMFVIWMRKKSGDVRKLAESISELGNIEYDVISKMLGII